MTSPVTPNVHQALLTLANLFRPLLQTHLSAHMTARLAELPADIVEQASRLPAHQQQNLMDIIVALRQHPSLVDEYLPPAIDQRLTRFVSLADSASTEALSVDLGHMRLIDADDIEVNVTIDTLAAQLARQMEPMLGEAFGRLGDWVPALTQADQLPFHPAQILYMQLDALKTLSLNARQQVYLLEHMASGLDVRPVAQLIDEALQQAAIPQRERIIRGQDGTAPREKEDLQGILRDIRDLNRKHAGGQGGTGGAVSGQENNVTTGEPQGTGVGQGLPRLAPGQLPPPVTDPQGVPVLYQATGGGVVVDAQVLTQQAVHFPQISPSVARVPMIPPNPFPLAQEQVIPTPDLVNLLSRLQAAQPFHQDTAHQQIVDPAEVRDSIRQQLHNDEEKVEVIGKTDTDVIDLVSMMFDFILDDQQLPTSMKALLGRLQIPMLKVAITDSRFFSGEDHPARRLLNLLAKAGIGWDEKARSSDQLYNRIEQTVFRIIENFETDLALFDSLLAEFEAFYTQQQQRVSQQDDRTREIEENRAKADLARTIVQQALNRRLAGRKLPFAVIRLLQEGWRHVLYLACVKEGTESESWRQSVKVVDALIWSMLPPEGDVQWLERLKNVSPKLINSLQRGMASVNFDTVQADSMIREIEQVHQGILEGLNTPTVELLDSDKPEFEAPATSVSVDDALKASQTAQAEPEAGTQVVLPRAEPVAVAHAGDTLPPTDRNLVAVRHMILGSWVEFRHIDHAERHKLVARVRSADKLIFANHRGIKVAEMTCMQLAIELHQERAVLLDSQGEIMDRTLRKVVDGLRQVTANS